MRALIAKIILDYIDEQLKSFTGRGKGGFRSGSFCIGHINILRIILQQRPELRFPFHLLLINFKNALDSVTINGTDRLTTIRILPLLA